MTIVAGTVGVVLFSAAFAAAQIDVRGRWDAQMVIPGGGILVTFDLTTQGSTVNGTVKGVWPNNQEIVAAIYDGTIDGGTLTFKVKSPDGDRVITFTGKPVLDERDRVLEIAFTRSVDVRPGGSRGGRGIFGADGAMTLIAKRAQR